MVLIPWRRVGSHALEVCWFSYCGGVLVLMLWRRVDITCPSCYVSLPHFKRSLMTNSRWRKREHQRWIEHHEAETNTDRGGVSVNQGMDDNVPGSDTPRSPNAVPEVEV